MWNFWNKILVDFLVNKICTFINSNENIKKLLNQNFYLIFLFSTYLYITLCFIYSITLYSKCLLHNKQIYIEIQQFSTIIMNKKNNNNQNNNLY